MEVIRTRDEVIERLIEIMLFLSWSDRLGRVLIENKEINPTLEAVENTRQFLKNASYTIHMKERVLMPMGSLSGNTSPIEVDIGFYFASIDKEVEVITSRISSFSKMRLTRIGEKRSRNALVQWFSDLQMNPDSVRMDLREIRNTIKEKRGG